MKLELDRIERKSYKLIASLFTDNFYERLQQGSTFHMIFLTSLWSLPSSLFIVPLLFTLTGSPSSPPMRAAGRRQLIQLFHRRLPCQVPLSYSYTPYLTLFPFPKFMFSKQGQSLSQHVISCPSSYSSYMELLCTIT